MHRCIIAMDVLFRGKRVDYPKSPRTENNEAPFCYILQKPENKRKAIMHRCIIAMDVLFRGKRVDYPKSLWMTNNEAPFCYILQYITEA